MISSEDLRFFNVLANSASLAEAARKMDVTPPAVTQRLNALEARIGIRLIDRSGRKMTLTDEGDLVASHGTIVGEAMEALSEALANRKKAVSGHLRISAPHGFGRLHVAPVVDAFAKTHPGVTVTLDLSDHPGAQLVESSDVIIHIGPPGAQNQIVTTLAPNRRIVCASPEYLGSASPIQSQAAFGERFWPAMCSHSTKSAYGILSGQGATCSARQPTAVVSAQGEAVR
jgi:DNA-binding transcriptional LysR family regulator